MKALQFCSPLLIAFMLSFLHPVLNSSWPYSDEFVKFLNTSEKIWIYNSTEKSKVRCKVDVMTSIDSEDYYFNRTIYWDDDRNTTTELLAALFEEVSLVGPRYSGTNTTEYLLYQNDNSTCSVYRVSFPYERGWYELRLRDSLLTQGPTVDCQEFFSNRTQKYNQTNFTGCGYIL
uniref:Salivary lipocalin n=1 Tax=Amblyomma variegatum TaxID=34610 RepID=F0JA00_AMBVA|nr:TPA_inf: salivary lipocalin [Amblyomma variegatum]